MFDRNDRGWSGRVDWSEAFLGELTAMIESELKTPIDLSKEYLEAISDGTLSRTVPAATQELLNMYPGYPEKIWNERSRQLEYAK